MGKIAFVSDIHINPSSPKRLSKFRHFLDYIDNSYSELYLLGDIFDYWIGRRHLELLEFKDAIKLLRKFTQKGVKTHFIYGNRDYLIDEKFSQDTGVNILGENAILELDGKKIFCAHGDFIYNKNIKYTIYRRVMALGPVKNTFTSLPPKLSKSIASGYKSTLDRCEKYRHNYKLNIIEPAKKIFAKGYDVLICGHIHKSQKVTLKFANREREIFILGNWDNGCEYLEYVNNKFELKSFKEAHKIF